MNDAKLTIGIIGYGSFGAFLARKLDAYATVKVSSRREVPEQWVASLKDVAACEWLIPAIPLQAYEKVLSELKPHIRTSTKIVDVCSVKQQPTELIRKLLPDNKLISTHPMFGPESAETELAGHTIILCPDESSGQEYQQIKDFSQSIGLEVAEMSVIEHDQLLAKLHGLTFFVARALDRMAVGELPIMTPSYRKLVKLAELEHHHSDDLFHTIQQGNEFTGKIRQDFVNQINALQQELETNG